MWRGYRAWPFRRQLLLAGGILALLIVLSAVARPVQFSYAGNNCYDRLVILPELQRASGDEYQVQYGNVLRVGGVSLSASKVCITAVSAPRPLTMSTMKTSLLGIPLLGQQSFAVHVPELPVVNYHIVSDGIAVTRPLEIPMNSTDRLFEYVLKSTEKTGVCVPKERAMLCDIQSLGLKQGAKYHLSLERRFAGKLVKTLMSREVTTLSPVSVLESTVKPDEVVFTRPTSIVFKMDKQITAASAKLERHEGEKRIAIEQAVKVNGQTIEVSFAELPRSSQYRLTLSDVMASDGSSLLDQSYVLPFSTSGGPKVTGVNIGRYGVALGTTVVVTFDQNLSPSQDIGALVKLMGGVGNMSRSGNQLRFSTASVPLCGDFSITLTNDISSEHGVGGNSAWSYSSRAICHTVATIGYTAKGRAITAYKFGTGSQIILYVGAIHGNERGTYLLMSEWVDELESKARTIPADKSIIVIPAVNRDGLASGGRRNGNNVDLNRNFASATWGTNRRPGYNPGAAAEDQREEGLGEGHVVAHRDPSR